MSDVQLRPAPYDHPDVQVLVEQVQAEYVRRYGGRDDSPVDPAEFAAPYGAFFVACLDGRSVATGGWRFLPPGTVRHRPGMQAEVRRMYVVLSARGRGVARAVLRHLERDARRAGADWLVLETGMVQPEAIGLYRSSGYADVPAFGHYASSPLSVHLGRRLPRVAEEASLRLPR